MTKHDVLPLLDIHKNQFADQYQQGAWWARYGDEQGKGPQPDSYFITNVTWLIDKGRFHDLQSPWFPLVGFFLGMVHGGILDPVTGLLRPDVTTLVRLNDPDLTRGYRAGRVWFFYEADPNERRLTDSYLMQRLHELARDRSSFKEEQGTINFSLGSLLGELSGQVFPLTQQEHEHIQEEDRQFLAECQAQRISIPQR